MAKWRVPECYGDVALSVQASSVHYCKPQIDGLPLEAYESVEVGLLLKGRLVPPSQVGLQGFDHLFQEASSPVAPYVSHADVTKLREALKERQEQMAGHTE